ncbi:MAG: hybrid sensor histidine kinase/response regulator [Burkholderiales bacterium]|nr:MAG: hybrid sensor histidine kinase/response regulator [Burkholderiales bacterium]
MSLTSAAEPRVRRYRPITRRFAQWVIGLTLGLLLAHGAVESVFAYRESLQHIERLQGVQAEAAALEIASYVKQLHAGLARVAMQPWGLAGFGPSQQREEFHQLMRAQPAITALQAVDANDRERMFASRWLPDRQDSGRTVSLPPAATGVQHGRTQFLDGELPTLQMAATTGDGAILATVDLRHLSEIVSRPQAGAGGVAYVVDGQGLLIAHPRALRAMGRQDLSGTEGVQLARARRQAGAIALHDIDMRNLAGQRVVVTAAQVPGTDWIVFMEQLRSEAFGPVRDAITRTAVLMILGGTLALVLGSYFARRLAAPIVALRNATARMAAGDLQARIAARHHDEVEDLALDFNRIVEQLRESYATLEAKVADRTAELSDARDVLAARADQLTQLKDEAERANAAKTRFLAAASHDLRQPMHSISLLVGVLRARLSNPTQIDLADKVQASVSTMENLFGNLLDISKLDAGAVHAHIEDVDLGWLLERAAHTWMPQAQEKGLSLRVRPGRWIVRGDATLLERIVGNLLANAIRYTRQGGVLVGCRRRGDHCELQIWDTGPGIAAEHREAIFEEFFRIGAPGTGQEKGLGLGLSIVRRCAGLLGYDISVESREGRGSVFKVRLPLAAVNRLPQASDSQPGALPQSLDGSFIVVVDDEATNREAVRDALLAAGCHVVTASGADEALAQLQAHLRTPDLILTDYQLGADGDGLDVIRRLRAHYDEEVPAMMVTANTDTGLGVQAASLGARLLHKPVGLQRLLWAIKETLEGA